jgi:hypothetical protein
MTDKKKNYLGFAAGVFITLIYAMYDAFSVSAVILQYANGHFLGTSRVEVIIIDLVIGISLAWFLRKLFGGIFKWMHNNI